MRDDFHPPFEQERLLAIARRNRERLFEVLGEDEAVLVFTAPLVARNADADHRYRPSSDVIHLSAWLEPDCALLLRPGAEERFVMFVQGRDPDKEVWTGPRPGPEGAVERWGADAAYPYAELAERLPDLLQGVSTLHYRFAEDAERDRLVVGAIAAARRKARDNGLDVPDTFVDPVRVLHELRLVKTEGELALLRRAAAITREAHLAAMRATRPGVGEYEIEALIDYTFRRHGAVAPGYATIVGGGANATTLHYVDNRDPLRAGDLVCVDAGCEVGFYTADVTRTWPVDGRFTPAQRELYDLVLDALVQATDEVRPGRTWKDVHDRATRVLTEGMVRLGLLPAWTPDCEHDEEAHVDWLIEEKKHKRYFMHGIGHWLGLDVHDAGAYAGGGRSRELAPGMVMTVEPGLYVAPDDEDAPERFRGMGIRIEDDVLVTEGDPEVLTADIPRDPEAIEALVGRGG